jgi:hypothetical protein
MSFFEDKKPKSADSTVYYIPIVEKILDVTKPNAWTLAADSKFHRLFYTSPEALYDAQKQRIHEGSILSCYKIFPTSLQCEIISRGHLISKGRCAALSFSPQDIVSCIKFSAAGNTEHLNPFYKSLVEKSEHTSYLR